MPPVSDGWAFLFARSSHFFLASVGGGTKLATAFHPGMCLDAHDSRSRIPADASLGSSSPDWNAALTAEPERRVEQEVNNGRATTKQTHATEMLFIGKYP